jgi:hypothetical protein
LPRRERKKKKNYIFIFIFSPYYRKYSGFGENFFENLVFPGAPALLLVGPPKKMVQFIIKPIFEVGAQPNFTNKSPWILFGLDEGHTGGG